MVNQEIVEGLKLALHRGETLKQAMMSFFNSGYDRNEIQEAARALYTQQDVIPIEHQVKHTPPEKPKTIFKPLNQLVKKIQSQTKEQGFEKPNQVPQEIVKENIKPGVFTQGVSDYGPKQSSPKKKLLLILLLLFFICLLGFFIVWFFFKEQFITLISGLTG
ncbi:MAG: hypothetical protein KKF48_00095 [Nanoarchaeota archaeon]|nr:hypothetical protein [Nanoarchaeota archaeon]MBU1027424.1 hypothetical protein [Nanoarchaeota archaeon]